MFRLVKKYVLSAVLLDRAEKGSDIPCGQFAIFEIALKAGLDHLLQLPAEEGKLWLFKNRRACSSVPAF